MGNQTRTYYNCGIIIVLGVIMDIGIFKRETDL